MAYTIISQNNSTTTLSDGVNTITVPSRVNLTSGNFTIVEVNNNMATLEDGDGNVYRDIPCVATLAGEGGGGGSGLPDQTGHSGEFLTTDGTDASWAAVDALPSQTGNAGKFLTTDGTDASWAAVNALQNTATGASSLSVGKATTANNVVTVVNSDSSTITTAAGSVAVGSGAFSQAAAGIAIGQNSSVYSSNGQYGISIGQSAATRGMRAINIGLGAGGNGGNGNYGIAIGSEAQAKQNYSIQLGSGSNNEAGTFYVASYYNSANVNYKLMDADGTIPTARFTTDPVSDGTYVPTLTISSGVATRSWSAPSGGLPSQTGNAGKFLTTDGTDASWANALANQATGINSCVVKRGTGSVSGNIVTVLNSNFGSRSYTANGFISIGSDHSFGNSLPGNSSTSIRGGIATGNCSVAIGDGVATGQYSTVINATNCSSTGDFSISVGINCMASALNAIQMGHAASLANGTNSDANTFKVANANGNFEIMDANGNLPADRLASTTGLADGNYRLRLTMASGVPTLSWVAE